MARCVRRPILLLTLIALMAACADRARSGPPLGSASSPSPSPLPPSPSPTFHIAPIPEGTYETDVTRADARRFGVFECDPQDVDENTGHIALTLRAGRFRWVIRASHPIFSPVFTGVYSGAGHIVTLTFDPNTADEGADTLRWSFDGKALRFKVLSALPDISGAHLCVARMQYEAHPWVKR